MIRNIAVHKFYDENNINGFWHNVLQEYQGLMDENKTYCVVSENDRKFCVKENQENVASKTV